MLRNSAIVYFAFATGLHAQTVVVNDNIQIQTSPIGDSISFDISKYAEFRPDDICGCSTEMNMTYSGETLMVDNLTADEASDWFLTQPGDVFSAATIDAGLFPVLFNVGSEPTASNTLSVGPDDFYFGVRTGNGFTNQRPNRTAYGWVHLRPVNGGLMMVENVMSYNSRGIIVGTTIVVPEPCAGILVVGALATLLTLRRQR